MPLTDNNMLLDFDKIEDPLPKHEFEQRMREEECQHLQECSSPSLLVNEVTTKKRKKRVSKHHANLVHRRHALDQE